MERTVEPERRKSARPFEERDEKRDRGTNLAAPLNDWLPARVMSAESEGRTCSKRLVVSPTGLKVLVNKEARSARDPSL